MKIPFLNLFRARDKPRDAVSAAMTFFFGSSASGKAVNPRNAVQVSTVYACVRVIAETIASLPVGVYESTVHGFALALHPGAHHAGRMAAGQDAGPLAQGGGRHRRHGSRLGSGD